MVETFRLSLVFSAHKQYTNYSKTLCIQLFEYSLKSDMFGLQFNILRNMFCD